MENAIPVYRIEKLVTINTTTQRYVGPFEASIHDKSLDDICWRYRSELPPGIRDPEEEGIKEFYRTMLCGAISLDQMLNWCPSFEVLEEMFSYGFRLAEYFVESENVFRGKTQVVWHPEHARYSRSLSVSEVREML